MATKKQNFWTYYSSAEGKKRLGGKTIEQAYTAMQKEAARRGKGSRSDNQSVASDPIARRLERARVGSVANKSVPKPAVAPKGGSPYRRWAEGGFKMGTSKGSPYRNHVEGQKPGARAFAPDDILGNKARQAKYAENRRIAENKRNLTNAAKRRSASRGRVA